MHKVSAVLLAAGESVRMGSPKALLAWGGSTLLEYQVAQLLASRCGEIVVVLGHDAERLEPLLPVAPLLRTVVNPDYRLGKTTSIRAGIAALSPRAEAALVLAVDQPRPAWLLDRLIDEHLRAGAPITVPTHAGHRGHPPVFSASLFPELMRLSEERQGLREVLSRHANAVHLVEVEGPLALVDLNRPEDYVAARALYDAQQSGIHRA